VSGVCLAAVFSGVPGEFELREFPVPRPAADEILVRVLGCTICASDLHSFFGRRETPVPSILGHEIVGQIVEAGSTATIFDLRGERLAPGDRIVWTLVASCGECPNCTNDLPQKCARAIKYGHHALRPGRELLGGLAEYCLLLPGTGVMKVPAELTLGEACPLGCATATIAAGMEAADEVRDRSVLVVGAGMLGLTACAMAQSRGARHVFCVDTQPARRRRASQFGATRSLAPEEVDAAIQETTGGRGVDVALEISGANAGFQACWKAVRVGGRIILLGAVFPSPPVPLTMEHLVRRNLTVRGVHNYAPRHLVSAVDFLGDSRGKYPFDSLVSAWFPLSQAKEAFQSATSADAIRIGVLGQQ
jgi:putative phosphonate catabolism associated alcohol dehydrogenase